MKSLPLVLCVFVLCACNLTPRREVQSKWEPNDSTLIPPTNNMKTWAGKEIPNTALVGNWRLSSVYDSDSDSFLHVDKQGHFKLRIPESISDEAEANLQSDFSLTCKKGEIIEGTVKCYDQWLAEGTGPDGCYVVVFFDNDNVLLHYYAFVYCQINDDQFTFDNVDGDGIFFDLTPVPKRRIRKMRPEDYDF